MDPLARVKQMSDLKARLEPIGDLGKGRGDFDRDYTAILYSHAFRRLKHKTQVFFYVQNDHVCTRLDHSLYVAAISEVVCKNLKSQGVDCDLTLARAIGIGHDLGHAPFGHAGEEILNGLAKDIGGFKHENHGLRIVDRIEKPRHQGPSVGLNLTLAVRDGIVNHCGEDRSTCISPASPPTDPARLQGNSYPCTLEGCVVRLVDKVAYLGRDLEDAIVAGLIVESQVPAEIAAIIGTKNGEIVDYFVGDMIENSDSTQIALSEDASRLMDDLISFNSERIYGHEKIESFTTRVTDVLETLYDRFLQVLPKYRDRVDLYMNDGLPVLKVLGKYIGDRKVLYFREEVKAFPSESELFQRIAIDFLSTLTDSFVFQACRDYFLPPPIV